MTHQVVRSRVLTCFEWVVYVTQATELDVFREFSFGAHSMLSACHFDSAGDKTEGHCHTLAPLSSGLRRLESRTALD